jgi:hypothetical protein
MKPQPEGPRFATGSKKPATVGRKSAYAKGVSSATTKKYRMMEDTPAFNKGYKAGMAAAKKAK